jgi:hypothetical protein
LVNLKRVDRYTVGAKIDNLFTSLLEIIFRATFAYDKFEKLSLVSQAIGKCDLIKFFLQIAWEQKVIDRKIYASLIIPSTIQGECSAVGRKASKKKLPLHRSGRNLMSCREA